MGAVVWMLAAICVLWFGVTFVLPIDDMLFIITIALTGALAVKAAADGIDAIKSMSSDFGGDDDDY